MTGAQSQRDRKHMDPQTLLAHYERIIEISQQLNTTLDHMALLKKIITAATELINADAASIMLLDESTGELRFAAATNINPHEMEEIIVPLEGSIAGWIATHGEPRVIADVTKEPSHFQGVDNTIAYETRNLLGVPMRAHNKIIGVLQVVNKLNGANFTEADIETLTTLASQAGTAIENARLFQQSDFIAEMVHELRTPLAALKASTTLLLRPEIGEEKRREIIETMQNETNRLIQLTTDFLDLARMESGRTKLELAPFDLNKLIVESVEVVRQQAEDKHIRIFVPTEINYVVKGDRGKLKQVLLNLLTNAIKYNREGGNITIYTEQVEIDEKPFVEVAVQDTGYGISKENQRHMFQKFFRVASTEGYSQGTGLGLAITKHIVEAHGGHIGLESEEGVGSTFYFTIPLAQE
ncbi:MAG: GAF domain-containing protein [Chloroflexi bacterium]|nr:MAG: GAF domain-containing protein [Chloroflexota bacterium]